MSEFYDRMAATALRLIDRFGVELVIRRVETTGYDPVSGAQQDIAVTQSVRCVVKPASQGAIEAFDERFSGDSLVESRLRALVIAAQSAEWMPMPGDKVSFEGADWAVIGCTPVSPGGTPLIYRATIRQ